MAAPVKQGVQGGDSMENEAEGPKFDLWLPPVPLWLLSGHPERSSPPQAAKYSRPGTIGANFSDAVNANSPNRRNQGTPGQNFHKMYATVPQQDDFLLF